MSITTFPARGLNRMAATEAEKLRPAFAADASEDPGRARSSRTFGSIDGADGNGNGNDSVNLDDTDEGPNPGAVGRPGPGPGPGPGKGDEIG